MLPSLVHLLKPVARWTLPVTVRRGLRARWQGREYCPRVGGVEFGNFRRKAPISRAYGYDRGLPIDRYYIENFLGSHTYDIHGRVLEIGDNSYTRRFGRDRVMQSDVLGPKQGNRLATIVADLNCADHIPSDIFECIIFTQTLQLIYDSRAALRTLQRILKPGGVLLATFPGITCRDRHESGDYWRFTVPSATRLFNDVYGQTNADVESYGNLLAAISFLSGLATEELRQEELDYRDPAYEVTIAVRAVKR
jgi:hypothetical protein